MADHNISFEYVAINQNGLRTKGFIEAADTQTAELELKKRGLEVITIEKKNKKTFNISFGKKKVKAKEIVLFTRFLATMIAAGMPILKALDVIVRDQPNPQLQSVINSLRVSISSGSNFSQALRQHPKYFSPLYCSLVSAGEASSTLDKVLERLAKYLEKIEILKNKVKNAMIYPFAIVFVATAVSLVLLIFVIPKFQNMFESAHVPLPYFTQLVIAFSNALRNYWWAIIAILTLGFFGTKILVKRKPIIADKMDSLLLKTMVIGPILKKAIIARFTRTLSITLEAGLPIVESMRSMVDIVNNKVFSQGVQQICDGIISGRQLSASMEATKLFPTMVIQMIAVGEASGKLEEMLNNIANYYEEDVNSIADNLTNLMEPVIIVVLGLIIGCFIIAMYLPIFKLGSTI